MFRNILIFIFLTSDFFHLCFMSFIYCFYQAKLKVNLEDQLPLEINNIKLPNIIWYLLGIISYFPIHFNEGLKSLQPMSTPLMINVQGKATDACNFALANDFNFFWFGVCGGCESFPTTHKALKSMLP